MSNYRHPVEQSEPKISRETFTDFLMLNGYIGDIKMLGEQIILYKGALDESAFVTLPFVEVLSQNQIRASLSRTSILYSAFEEYIESVTAMDGTCYHDGL